MERYKCHALCRSHLSTSLCTTNPYHLTAAHTVKTFIASRCWLRPVGETMIMSLYVCTDTFLCLAKVKARECSQGHKCQGIAKKRFFVIRFCREQAYRNIAFCLSYTQPMPVSANNHVGKGEKQM